MNDEAMAAPEAIRLEDYQPPAWRIDTVSLTFDLAPTATRVESRLTLSRTGDGPLRLDGEGLRLIAVRLDGRDLDGAEYGVDGEGLTVHEPPASCVLETIVEIDPQANTKLEGLYLSNAIYCTQCEAEGFRRITYFLDRPDVMTTFEVRIRAEAAACPVLLSNGNLVESATLPDGRHEAVWHDPFPKPAYLFALVAGRLGKVADRFRTASGRDVDLAIYVDPGNENRAGYAMQALIRSMRWDEEVFGLEYDLDLFNIVAIADFNMGAMENKSLNVFNAKYVLADPETATDQDHAFIESIVAHEYFHNWTGNRVTCRDWFQLSLKEGLTVFRDQQFSADMRSAPVQRIQDVRGLRHAQFPEDSGPLAHPVRPASYIEINNFYTATVYEKGAEVVRLLHTLLGTAGFRRGMDLYFERHDGQAVTCDDFAAAMADANDMALGDFKLWYAQAGTPEVTVETAHDAAERRFTVTLTQHTPPTPGQPEKAPLRLPLELGLIDRRGEALALRFAGEEAAAGTSRLVELDTARRDIVFEDVAAPPLLSLNRNFTAPIKLNDAMTSADRAFLMRHDTDPFNRWEAGQRLAVDVLLARVRAFAATGQATAGPDDEAFLKAFAACLADDGADDAFRAELLALPSEAYLAEQMAEIDVDGVHAARHGLMADIAAGNGDVLLVLHDRLASDEPYSPDGPQVGARALRNRALGYLAHGPDAAAAEALLAARYVAADNMTDRMAALALLAERDCAAGEAALADFHDRFRDDTIVIDKWFSVQAISSRPDTLARVESLLDHAAFSLRNPNRVRALIGAFVSGNPLRFHAADGTGYEFLTRRIAELDPLNPQVAARLIAPLGRWRRFGSGRGASMRAALQRILATDGLSKDVFELASKSLGEIKDDAA